MKVQIYAAFSLRKIESMLADSLLRHKVIIIITTITMQETSHKNLISASFIIYQMVSIATWVVR